MVDAELSKGEVKKLDGFNKNAEKTNAFLIGQLAKNSAIENNTINLKHILDEVNSTLGEVKALIGGRTVLIECEDNESLINLYEKHGFKVLPMQNNDDPLKTMYTTLIKK
ncbi:hypothetical protein ACR30L_12020 [Psychromonas sp. PT13]|uniref:hypothetical protein n=1 Tax=Psychromonas sp. PT13 TaxID=3439547 RepID=UPI003EBF3DE1